MIKGSYDSRIVMGYLFMVFFIMLFIGYLGNMIMQNKSNPEQAYKQDVYDLKIPSRNCKLYVIHITGERETKVIDCDGVISAPVQVEHHSTSHGSSHTNDVTPIVIKDK
jgi:hypothetical protein